MSKIVLRKFLRNFSGTSPDYQASVSLKIFADASPYRRGPTLTLTNYQYRIVIKKGDISTAPLVFIIENYKFSITCIDALIVTSLATKLKL